MNIQADREAILALRLQHYGPNAALNYEEPLLLVRGQGCHLYDEAGKQYLDCVNNVAHLGHCHPQVVQAVAAQMGTLNTNSRYLHPSLVEYTQRLLATMPKALDVLYMVNSGSEANDLALRIARAATGATHVVVMGAAYHGHTGTLIDCSPYKFWAQGGEGRAHYVHVIPCPDTYRGHHLNGRKAAQAAIAQAHAAGGRVAAFYAESVLSCGGQVVMPPGYLQEVYDEMHAEGALCVADEVQCGFGRVGSCFWGFQLYDVVPDIVTLGKPMGNGYPVAGVVTTSQWGQAFSNGMEYFNTFGGSTAAVAAALSVLTILQEGSWMEHSAQVGGYLLQQLRTLQRDFPCVGDVRGSGLMAGLECVRDPVSRRHAPALAKWIKERCKVHCVLLSCDGPYDNVIKVKPPLLFGRIDVDHLVATLRRVLHEDLTPDILATLDLEEEAVWSAVYGPRSLLYAANAHELGLGEPAALSGLPSSTPAPAPSALQHQHVHARLTSKAGVIGRSFQEKCVVSIQPAAQSTDSHDVASNRLCREPDLRVRQFQAKL